MAKMYFHQMSVISTIYWLLVYFRINAPAIYLFYRYLWRNVKTDFCLLFQIKIKQIKDSSVNYMKLPHPLVSCILHYLTVYNISLYNRQYMVLRQSLMETVLAMKTALWTPVLFSLFFLSRKITKNKPHRN